MLDITRDVGEALWSMYNYLQQGKFIVPKGHRQIAETVADTIEFDLARVSAHDFLLCRQR